MVQWFRSFSWVALVPLAVFAGLLQATAWGVVDAADLADRVVRTRGAWGGGGPGETYKSSYSIQPIMLVALLLPAVGLLASASLQQYRLANAGTLPAYLSALLGSAAAAWWGFDASLLATLAITGGAHQLYGAYRQQGASSPVYNAGLFIGLAWLLSAPFVWMAGWAFVALIQLRKVRGGDFLGLLLGILTLPFIWGMYAYAFGDIHVAHADLFDAAVTLPTLDGFRQNVLPLAVLAAGTLLALAGLGALTARRPVQEQRAHRMYFTMLPFAWTATLLSGGGVDYPAVAFAPAPLLLPLSLLLGVWVLGWPRKLANALLIVVTFAVVGAHVYRVMSAGPT